LSQDLSTLDPKLGFIGAINLDYGAKPNKFWANFTLVTPFNPTYF